MFTVSTKPNDQRVFRFMWRISPHMALERWGSKYPIHPLPTAKAQKGF